MAVILDVFVTPRTDRTENLSDVVIIKKRIATLETFPTFMGTKLSDEVIRELIEKGQTNKPVTIKVHLKMEDGKVRMDFGR